MVRCPISFPVALAYDARDQLHLDMSLLIVLFGGSGCISNVAAHTVPMHQQCTPGKAASSKNMI